MEETETPKPRCGFCSDTKKVVVGMDAKAKDGLAYGPCGEC